MIKKKHVLMILVSLLFSAGITAQEKKNTNTADSSAKENVTTPTATADNPPPDQFMETKKIRTKDKAGNVQEIKVIEFF